VIAANPRNISHLKPLTPPPDLSRHDPPQSTTTTAPARLSPSTTTYRGSVPTTIVRRYSPSTTTYSTPTTSGY
jgi:hypothetical protein